MKLKFLSIELKYRLSRVKLNNKLVVTSLIGALVLGGAVTAFKALENSRKDIDVFENTSNGTLIVQKDEREVLMNREESKVIEDNLTNNWDDFRDSDKARYGRRMQKIDPNVNINIIEPMEFIKQKHKDEQELIKALNKEVHRIVNGTEAILAMYRDFSVVGDYLVPEDIKEEILYYNEEISNAYENINKLERGERFDAFNLQFDKYYRENKEIYDLFKNTMSNDICDKTDKETAYNLLTGNMEKWNYVVNLYNY